MLRTEVPARSGGGGPAVVQPHLVCPLGMFDVLMRGASQGCRKGAERFQPWCRKATATSPWRVTGEAELYGLMPYGVTATPT